MPADLHGSGDLYEVKIRGHAGHGVLDRHGNRILSTSAAQFPLHTDGYNLAEPPRFVLLLRIDATSEVPTSTLSDVIAAIATLNDADRQRLRCRMYGSARGPVAVLDNAGDAIRIRFNPVEMRRWSAPKDRKAIDDIIATVEAAMALQIRTFELHRGDCVIVDNWRVSHGREALTPRSGRVVLRMWVADDQSTN
jgi:alpha-ketoglutarate-dependent taurine dioxygenase